MQLPNFSNIIPSDTRWMWSVPLEFLRWVSPSDKVGGQVRNAKLVLNMKVFCNKRALLQT